MPNLVNDEEDDRVECEVYEELTEWQQNEESKLLAQADVGAQKQCEAVL
jgi:hypothetical protein